MSTQTQIVVIYDGECAFCAASVEWIQQKLVVLAEPFQQAALLELGLTREQCAQSVQVVADQKIYSGAAAIGYLLARRGNQLWATLIKAAGPVAQWGYRWVATHRSSLVVRLVHKLLLRSNAKHRSL